MKKRAENFMEKLDLDPQEFEVTALDTEVDSDTDIMQDYRLAKANVMKSMKITEQAVEILFNQLQLDRNAFTAQALCALVSNMGRDSNQLIKLSQDLAKTLKDASTDNQNPDAVKTINKVQNIFITGNMNDVIKMFKNNPLALTQSSENDGNEK
jgi:uncharacterized membrane protein YgaE (UPF0421/DUF939 family)